MDELAKAVQKKYIEDITSRYPLHRFLILFMVLISVHLHSKADDVRVLSNLQTIKLNFVFDFDKGLLASVNFEQLVISILISSAVGYIYSKLSSMSFSALAKASTFDLYITEIREKINSKKSQEETLNYFLAKDVSKELQGLRLKLKGFHTRAEVFFAIALIISFGFRANTLIDWLLVITLAVLIIANIWKAFRFYISDFLPYYVTEQTLLGANVNFGDK